MKKKIIILTAMMLLWAGVLQTSANIDDFHKMNLGMGKGTLYVGGSGPGNYTTIQEAIGDSVNGDTIFVYNGTYNENINIPKRISIVGEDKDTTIINGVSGEDAVVLILISEVHISGFTIIGAASGQDGIQVLSLMQDVVINNNIIKQCAYGIFLTVTTEHETISSNTIIDNDFAGIRLQESDRNDIFNNIVDNNGDWGIALESLSKQNSLTENIVTNNVGGIRLSGNSEQNDIMDNEIRENDLEGILIEGLSISNNIEGNNITDNFGGIKLTASGQNVINENNIENNSMEGLLIESSNSNLITKNNFIGNRRQARYQFSSRNDWNENYWDNWIGFIFEAPIFQSFPKVIKGIFLFNIDPAPALEPYVI